MIMDQSFSKHVQLKRAPSAMLCCNNMQHVVLVLLASLAAHFRYPVVEAQVPVSFTQNYLSSTDPNHIRILNAGGSVDLVLDQYSAAAFGSKTSYLYGKIGIGIKLVPGNSAGTVTAYYLSSPGLTHDEMDFEFLGNVSGQPYTLQTNVYAKGVGGREQRVNLWFDPSTDFHYYSVLWNWNIIVFLVDETPVRVFRNNENLGVPFPNSQGVGIYASIWDGSNWATDDGWVKLNWTYAPFIASFQDFGVDACEVENSNVEACIKARGKWWNLNTYLNLNANQIQALHNVQSNYLVYDYCTDTKRYPTMPVECASNWYK
jgi:xyloglucan:xyloglucosyl transferase